MICLDEITLHKGHGKYLLVISAPQLGLVLDVLEERSKEKLLTWLEERGEAWREAVEVVCSDMWDAYQEAAAEKLPHAHRVIDRFHVMKNLNDALTKARRVIQRNADEATKEQLKGCRWLLVRNCENLTTEEKEKLTRMLAVSPELAVCYNLKEDFRAIFNQPCDNTEAEKKLRDWVDRVETLPYKALKTFIGTLRNWWQPILNYFVGRYNNGFAEGVNLKIKMLNRRGFGYRNFQSFRLHVLVAFCAL